MSGSRPSDLTHDERRRPRATADELSGYAANQALTRGFRALRRESKDGPPRLHRPAG